MHAPAFAERREKAVAISEHVQPAIRAYACLSGYAMLVCR